MLNKKTVLMKVSSVMHAVQIGMASAWMALPATVQTVIPAPWIATSMGAAAVLGALAHVIAVAGDVPDGSP